MYFLAKWHGIKTKHTCRFGESGIGRTSGGWKFPELTSLRSVSSGNFQPPSVRPIPDSPPCKYVYYIDASIQIYQALIQPHFDYCCTVWDGLGETLSTKLQKLQNRAARVIMRSSYDTDASVLLDNLRWDNLSSRRQKLKLGLMFKTLKSNAPIYLQEFFSIRGTGYNLRNSEMRLNLPKPRTNYLKRSFCYSGALLWNSLPQEIRKLQTQDKFKKALNKYFDE